MPVVLKNNVVGYLSTAISASDVGVALQAGNGAAFPAIGAGQYFYATLVSGAGTIEVVKVTARVQDTLTIVRAQDDSTAQSFEAGARVEMRVNAASVEDIVSDAVAGLGLASAISITDSGNYYTGTNVEAALAELGPRFSQTLPAVQNDVAALDTRVDAVEADITALEASVAGIVSVAIPVGLITLWSGSIATIPAGWILCDGTSGTPDLRGRFIMGGGGGLAIPGTSGGTASATTEVGGAHTHTLTIAGHALTVNEMPAHGHPWSHNNSSQASVQSSPSPALGGIVTSNLGSSVTETAFAGTATAADGEQIGGAGANATHTHTGSTANSDGSHTHSVTIYPPYYVLAYIMYVGA